MRVAIAGYGAEGVASYEYYVAQGDDVTIVTNKVAPQFPIPEGAKSIVSPDAFRKLIDFDIVLRTPPMRPDSVKTKGKVWSATNEFFAKCPAQIIGVTGTKGKGTTCSLIASILRAAGKKVHLVGNIGTPALEVLPMVSADDVVVYELSSFQLWDIKMSPHIAVILMIEPDHLDVHKDFNEYLSAKSNIVRYQSSSDVTIWNQRNQFSSGIAHSNKTISIPYLTEFGSYAKDGYFWFRRKKICPVTALNLPGEHNIENACAAITASRYVIENNFSDAVEKGLSDFTGLPHRLKFVREVEGVRYYDDSIATTPGSAIAGLRAFDAPKIIILGGSDKGASYQEIIELCKQVSALVIAVGQTGEKIEKMCRQYGVRVTREPGNMTSVVTAAKNVAVKGSVVMLSPASASFDQYKSYGDRGDQFVAAVEEL